MNWGLWSHLAWMCKRLVFMGSSIRHNSLFYSYSNTSQTNPSFYRLPIFLFPYGKQFKMLLCMTLFHSFIVFIQFIFVTWNMILLFFTKDFRKSIFVHFMFSSCCYPAFWSIRKDAYMCICKRFIFRSSFSLWSIPRNIQFYF